MHEVITLWSCVHGVGYVCCYCSEAIPIRTDIALMDKEIKQHKMDCTKYLRDMDKVFTVHGDNCITTMSITHPHMVTTAFYYTSTL